MSWGRVAWLVAAVSVVLVAPARADILAAAEVHAPGSRQDFDIEVVNATTGAQVPLPAGVNTGADELHPSISADGNRLVFERRDSAAGTVRIIAVDLQSGQSSDLFTGIETSQNPPTSPVITSDGQTVATGGAFNDGNAEVTVTSLAPFPSGPYVHSSAGPDAFSSNGSGEVSDVAAGPANVFISRTVNEVVAELTLTQPVAGSEVKPAIGASTFDDPAVPAINPGYVLFVTRGIFTPGDIVSLPLVLTQFSSGPSYSLESNVPSRLPAVVDSSADESQPAVSPDGRFIAFVRHGGDGHDRLFVWDSQTQLLLNSSGVDLGAIDSSRVGSVGLYTKPVFSGGQVTVSTVSQVALANVEARLTGGSGLGILVQRIVGHQRILGRRAYKLRKVGRVPLGQFSKGRHHLHWNLRVNGRRLRPGRYLVTLRALSRQGVIRDLAKPDVIRIRR